jgi:FMN phosphatase YigB (HAD superfamily)
MVRAIFFDFYSVWAPDRLESYLEIARQQDPTVAAELQAVVDRYYFGELDIDYVADTIKFKLNRLDIGPDEFRLKETDISPRVIDFMRGLHAHFVKLGVLANLGKQEYELLNNFNNHNQLFEVVTGPIALQSPLLSQETFAKALQAIGEPPKSTLLVTGHEAYRQFAGRLGIATLQFKSFPELQRELDPLL